MDDAIVTVPTGWKRPASSAYDGFGNYMRAKIQKLDVQQFEDQPLASNIFANVSIYVTGHTKPSLSDLKAMIVQNGGRFCQYFQSGVTHVIATNLSASKEKELRNVKVVRPEWIVESVDQGNLLDWEAFALDPDSHLISPGKKLALSKKALDDSSPRRKTISTDPDFISKYYSSSRLHHLSTWKAELRHYTFRNIDTPTVTADRVVMHVDFDCFFVNVSLRDRPDLVGKPCGVAHGQGLGQFKTNDVASCSYEARAKGVSNGMSVGRALEHCPDLVILPYEFEKYKHASDELYAILSDFADALEAKSCDEAFLDVSYRVDPARLESVNKRVVDDKMNHKISLDKKSPIEYALDIRAVILERVKLSASIGIGCSPLLARLATKLAKPGGVYHLFGESAIKTIDSLKIDALPGIGYSLREKLWNELKNQSFINAPSDVTCGLVRTSFQNLKELQKLLGNKMGLQVWSNVRGQDETIVAEDSDLAHRKSVSAEINWGVRFETDSQLEDFIGKLSMEVFQRFQEIDTAGTIVPTKLTLNLRIREINAPHEPSYKYLGCGHCERISRSHKFDEKVTVSIINTLSSSIMRSVCEELTIKRYQGKSNPLELVIRDIRGIGIQLSDFENTCATPTKPKKRRPGMPVTLTQMWSRDSPIKTPPKPLPDPQKNQPKDIIVLAREDNHELFDFESETLDSILDYGFRHLEAFNLDRVYETISHLKKRGPIATEALVLLRESLQKEIDF